MKVFKLKSERDMKIESTTNEEKNKSVIIFDLKAYRRRLIIQEILKTTKSF